MAERTNMGETNEKAEEERIVYCSFCGKSQYEVKSIIADRTAFICNECVWLCMDILLGRAPLKKDEMTELTAPTPTTEGDEQEENIMSSYELTVYLYKAPEAVFFVSLEPNKRGVQFLASTRVTFEGKTPTAAEEETRKGEEKGKEL